MNVLSIALATQGVTLPPDTYEFGISAVNQRAVTVFQASPTFLELATGLYWWTVRRKSSGALVQEGVSFVQPLNSPTYRSAVLEGHLFTVTPTVHRLTEVNHISVRLVGLDEIEQDIVCIKYVNSTDQTVTVSLSGVVAKVRILIS